MKRISVLLAALLFALMAAAPATAQSYKQRAEAAVIDTIYDDHAVSGELARSSDSVILGLRERLHKAEIRAATSRQALLESRDEITGLKAQLIELAQQKDDVTANAIRLIRVNAEGLASSPDGLALLEQYNRGDRKGALQQIDAMIALNDMKATTWARAAASFAIKSYEDERAGRKISGVTAASVMVRLQDLVRRDPTVFDDWISLNTFAEIERRHDVAADAARHAVALARQPYQIVPAYMRLAGSERKMNKIKEAEELYWRLIAMDDVDPRDGSHSLSALGADPVEKLAEIASERGDFGRSEALYKEAFLRANDGASTLPENVDVDAPRALEIGIHLVEFYLRRSQPQLALKQLEAMPTPQAVEEDSGDDDDPWGTERPLDLTIRHRNVLAARTYNALGRAAEAETVWTKAIAEARKFAELDVTGWYPEEGYPLNPDGTGYGELADILWDYALDLSKYDRSAAAIRAEQRSIAALRKDYAITSGNRDDALLATRLVELAIDLNGVGQKTEARRLAKEAVTTAKRATDDPSTIAYVLSVAGQVFGKGPAAIEMIEEARSYAGSMLDKPAMDEDDLVGLVDTERKLGDLYQDAEQYDKAAAAFAAARALNERNLVTWPSSPEYLRTRAEITADEGWLDYLRDKFPDALALYGKAQAMLNALIATDPGDVDSQWTLVTVLHNKADVFDDSGEPVAAHATMAEAIALIEAMIRQHPHSQTYKEELAELRTAARELKH